MMSENEFRAKFQRIGELVNGLASINDPEAKTNAKALVQMLLDLHALGLERAMEIVAKQGDAGQRAIDDLASDPLVSSLLVLYGLHPLDFESRVLQAIDKVRPRVLKGGGELTLLAVFGSDIRLEIRVSGHACGSAGRSLRSIVEEALYESAPDIGQLSIEGLDEHAGSSGFVPLGKLGSVIAAVPAI